LPQQLLQYLQVKGAIVKMMDVGLEGNNLRLERGSGNRNTDSVIEKTQKTQIFSKHEVGTMIIHYTVLLLVPTFETTSFVVFKLKYGN
jgi:hypothetical protein